MRTLEVVTALQQPATRHVARAARWAIVIEDAPAAAAIVVVIVKIRASGAAVLSMTHRECPAWSVRVSGFGVSS